MRGAPNCSGVSTPISRIIPADAGSTKAGFGQSALERDHPRGCGEHGPLWRNAMTLCGSSPRMRGARRRWPLSIRQAGIIPADAGSTSAPITVRVPHQDHPRGCGEHLSSLNVNWASAGSSPRMRGAPVHLTLLVVSVGIIPADAGSTYRAGISHNSGRGSSPRMRGARTLL